MLNNNFYEKLKTASREEVVNRVKEFEKELENLGDMIHRENETTPEIRAKYSELKNIVKEEAHKYSLLCYDIYNEGYKADYMGGIKEASASGFEDPVNAKHISYSSVEEAHYKIGKYFDGYPEMNEK